MVLSKKSNLSFTSSFRSDDFFSPLGYKTILHTQAFSSLLFFEFRSHEKIMKFIKLSSAVFSTLKKNCDILTFDFMLCQTFCFQSYAIPRLLKALCINNIHVNPGLKSMTKNFRIGKMNCCKKLYLWFLVSSFYLYVYSTF